MARATAICGIVSPTISRYPMVRASAITQSSSPRPTPCPRNCGRTYRRLASQRCASNRRNAAHPAAWPSISSKGYTVIGSYTFSKWQQAVNLLNAADPAPLREISDSDAPHRINISSVWSLPFGKGRAFLKDSRGVVSRLVGGWEVSGIWSLQSGFALPWGNMIYYGDPANIQLPADQRTPEHWFNVAN